MGGSSSHEIGGVRVFKVHPGSPAAEAGLEVFFDFIVEVNGTKIEPSCQQAFAEKIQESENSQAKLLVFNTRAHSTREVIVAPRRWAGGGLLGATVRFDVVDPAENQGIRVLEVFPNSPAAHAGLVPFQDFLLGTAQAVFHDIDELVEAVTNNINQRMQVYVYNTDSESVREIILVPNNDWGGDGCIGCDIGTGLLHRIPAPRRLPGSSPSSAAAQAPPAPFSPAAPPVAAPPAATAGGVPGVPRALGSITGVAMGNIPPVPGAPVVQGVPLPGGPQEDAAGAPGGRPVAVAGVKWPPPPGYRPPDDDEAGASGPAASPVAVPVHHSISSSEFPRAPPGTPMDSSTMPPPTDFSGMDPSRFGNLAGGASPDAAASGAGLAFGAELYQPVAPDSAAASQAAALL